MTAWALRRQGQDALPLTLRARRLYILPTRGGVACAGLVAVCFLAGMNYGSGLAMLLCFWMAAFLLTAMLRTHRCLAGLTVQSAEAGPVFAGEKVSLTLQVSASVAAADLELGTGDATSSRQHSGSQHADDDGLLRITVAIPARRRGRWHAPPLELATRAPFGLFRCWTWLQMDVQTDIYPTPAGTRPVPESPGNEPGLNQQGGGLEELAGLRPFREGDSPRQVAWKAYARGQPLLVREYRGANKAERDLDYDMLAELDSEARLSQLSRWVVDCAARHEHFVLRLPARALLRGSDGSHRERCLTALARF